ncbi:MBL fold metallo-hydrolase [Candidatus Woesearchaeota archaeon]|nr:MBL fold metallo-hydrolase [Candidatus Woesearchaeota archaeon]
MQQLTQNIYKITNDCNVYFLDFAKKIIIDTGRPTTAAFVAKELSPKINPKKIDIVIFTHFHYDHIGNFSLFPKAVFYASQAEIDACRKDPFGAILNEEVVEKFSAKVLSIEKIEQSILASLGLEVIATPGHTAGSICIYYPAEKILFSGDTLFAHSYGRVDLPTSVPKEIMRSLLRLKKVDYKILCSGHDY